MNRRDVVRGLIGAGLVFALPSASRAQSIDTPYGWVFELKGLEVYQAYGVPGNAMPGPLRWLAAYGAVAPDAETAKRIGAKHALGVMDVLHQFDDKLSPLKIEKVTPVAGMDATDASSWQSGEDTYALISVQSGSWVQNLYGPITEDIPSALTGLLDISAKTSTRWPNTDRFFPDAPTTGAWLILPTLDDLPAGVEVTRTEYQDSRD